MRVGDLVTRKKYNNDIVFRIERIDNNKVYLNGEYLRLKADANLEDLMLYKNEKEMPELELELTRDSKLINGCVLHLDGDERYLNKCLEIYKKYNVPAVGYFMSEKDMDKSVTNFLIEHKPDILVITGHDNVKNKNGK